jgi:hypothetical protein
MTLSLTPDEYMTDLAPSRVAAPVGPRPRKQLLVYNKPLGQSDQIAAPVDELRTSGAYRRRSFAADAESAPVSAVTTPPLRKIPPEGGERPDGAPYQPGPLDPGYKFIPSQIVTAPGDAPQLAHGQGKKQLSPDDYMNGVPPQPSRAHSSNSSGVKIEFQPASSDWSISRAPEMRDAFYNLTGRALPVRVVGQGGVHNRFGYDHRNSMDVGLHPDSEDGQKLIGYLRQANIPFLAFRSAIPGVATGPHIHVGYASHRTSTSYPVGSTLQQSDIDRHMAGQDVSPAPLSSLPSPDAYMSDAAPGPRTSSKVVEDVDFSAEDKAQAASPSLPQIALDERVLTPYLMEKGTKINVSHGEPLDPAKQYRVTLPVNQDDTSESLQLKGLYHVARSLGMDQAQAQVAAQDAYSHGAHQSFIAGTDTPISDEDLAKYKKQGSTSFDFENPEAIKIYNWYIERGLSGPGQGLTANEMRNQRQLWKEIKDSPFKQGLVRGLGGVDAALGNAVSLAGMPHSDEFVKDAKRGERFASQVEAESPDQSFTAGLKRGAGAAIPQTAELLSLSKTRVPLALAGALEHLDEGAVPALKGAAQGEAMQLGMGATSKLLPPGVAGALSNAAIWTGAPALQAINQGKNPGEAIGEALPLGAMAGMGHDLGGEDARPARIDLRGKVGPLEGVDQLQFVQEGLKPATEIPFDPRKPVEPQLKAAHDKAAQYGLIVSEPFEWTVQPEGQEPVKVSGVTVARTPEEAASVAARIVAARAQTPFNDAEVGRALGYSEPDIAEFYRANNKGEVPPRVPLSPDEYMGQTPKVEPGVPPVPETSPGPFSADGSKFDVKPRPRFRSPKYDPTFTLEVRDESGQVHQVTPYQIAEAQAKVLRSGDADPASFFTAAMRGGESYLAHVDDVVWPGANSDPVADAQVEALKPHVANDAPALPVETVPTASYGSRNKLVDETSAQAARDALKAMLDPTRLHDITDLASALPHLAKIGAFHIEAGARNFASFSAKMLEDVGEDIRPYLKEVYGAAHELYSRSAGDNSNPALREAFRGNVDNERLLVKAAITRAGSLEKLMEEADQLRADWSRVRVDRPAPDASAAISALPHYATIGAFHLEAGSRKFTDWAAKMIEDVGPDVGPYIREVYALSHTLLGEPVPEDAPTVDIKKPRTPLLRTGVELYRAGILASGKLLLHKAASDVTFQVLEEMKRAPAVVIDMAVASRTGVRSVAAPSLRAMARSGYDAATHGMSTAARIKEGATPEQLARYGARELNSGSRIVDAYVNYTYRAYGATDAVMRAYAMRRSLEAQGRVWAINEARNGKILHADIGARSQELANNPTAEMQSQAVQDSIFATLANENAVSTARGGLRKKLQTSATGRVLDAAADVAMPFVRTSTNIAARTVEYSPAGMLKAGFEATAAIRRKAFTEQEQKAFSETFGRSVTGTTLMLLGYALAQKGYATGASDDDSGQARLNEATGRQANALFNPATKTWHSVAGIGPAGTLLAMGATIYQDTHGEKPSLLRGSVDAGEIVFNRSPLGRALELPTSRGDAERALGRKLGSFVPQPVADLATLTDSHERDARGFTGPILSRIPGARESLPVKMDALGHEKEFRRSQVLDPTHTTSDKTDDELMAQLVEIGKGFGGSKQRPYERTPDFVERQKREGQLIETVWRDAVKTDTFQKAAADDAERRKMLARLATFARQQLSDEVPADFIRHNAQVEVEVLRRELSLDSFRTRTPSAIERANSRQDAPDDVSDRHFSLTRRDRASLKTFVASYMAPAMLKRDDERTPAEARQDFKELLDGLDEALNEEVQAKYETNREKK